MAFFPEDEPGYRRAIASQLALRGVELVAGGPRRTEAGVLNSVYVIEPDGTLRARYDKRLLIPFAEYAPLDGFRLLRRSFGGVRAFVPGRPRPPLPTRVGAAGVLVCNESMFPEVAMQRVAEGATYLVNAANDGWIQDAEYAVQQFEIAVMRAVEQHRDMVRVSTSGPSAIVDATGRVRAETRPFTEATLVGTIRARTERSFYGRNGDLFAVLCAFLTLAALAAGDRGRGGDAAR
jgi:apolipoprotein N-acyltransferase